jgi:hypothetical protein
MRPITFLALLLFMVVSTASPAVTFISGTEDIPLMAPLKECDPKTQSLFSSPEGRIISLVARGKVAWHTLTHFYEPSLRNLGWKSLPSGSFRKELVFQREKETLTITQIKDRNGILFVRFDYVEG